MRLSESPLQNIVYSPSIIDMIQWTLVEVIIIKKDWQYKAGRGRLPPYQSEDPSPTHQPTEEKKRKGK